MSPGMESELPRLTEAELARLLDKSRLALVGTVPISLPAWPSLLIGTRLVGVKCFSLALIWSLDANDFLSAGIFLHACPPSHITAFAHIAVGIEV